MLKRETLSLENSETVLGQVNAPGWVAKPHIDPAAARRRARKQSVRQAERLRRERLERWLRSLGSAASGWSAQSWFT